MSYKIEPRKVAGVVIEANNAISGKDFNSGEVLLGLTELIGRTIVATAETHIQMKDMEKVVHSHLNQAITIGSGATGKRLIESI